MYAAVPRMTPACVIAGVVMVGEFVTFGLDPVGGSSAFAVDLSQSLGSRNVELAESFLRSAGIPVVERDVSGKHGRRLVFQISDGVTIIKNFDQL